MNKFKNMVDEVDYVTNIWDLEVWKILQHKFLLTWLQKTYANLSNCDTNSIWEEYALVNSITELNKFNQTELLNILWPIISKNDTIALFLKNMFTLQNKLPISKKLNVVEINSWLEILQYLSDTYENEWKYVVSLLEKKLSKKIWDILGEVEIKNILLILLNNGFSPFAENWDYINSAYFENDVSRIKLWNITYICATTWEWVHCMINKNWEFLKDHEWNIISNIIKQINIWTKIFIQVEYNNGNVFVLNEELKIMEPVRWEKIINAIWKSKWNWESNFEYMYAESKLGHLFLDENMNIINIEYLTAFLNWEYTEVSNKNLTKHKDLSNSNNYINKKEIHKTTLDIKSINEYVWLDFWSEWKYFFKIHDNNNNEYYFDKNEKNVWKWNKCIDKLLRTETIFWKTFIVFSFYWSKNLEWYLDNNYDILEYKWQLIFSIKPSHVDDPDSPHYLINEKFLVNEKKLSTILNKYKSIKNTIQPTSNSDNKEYSISKNSNS